MITRQSEAFWEGALKNGRGKMRIGSNGYEAEYSFFSRFEDSLGTNPEELIGAALAGCFSMALAHSIAEAGFTSINVKTKSKVHLDASEKGFSISRIELETTADIPGFSEEQFLKLAKITKENCPVSRALSGVEISLDATLER